MVLERQNQEVQKRIKSELASSQGTESTLRGQFAGISADMEKLQQDSLMLSGRIDEINHTMNRKGTTSEGDLKTRQDKMEERLAQIERYLNLDSSGGKPPVVPKAEGATTAGATAIGPKELTADQLYTT
ncbi:MAG: hypothetical protein HZB87_14185, partial [Desulfatitalea sp.]|nr:hypothetical protein [Desulfatitalea sp.]